MAAHSQTLPQHKVFINFRGEEVRNNFVAHLDRTLKNEGINAFIDGDDGIGKSINDLFKRIEESRVVLTVFSSRYTVSKWCLNELVKIKECADEGKLIVVPIFYKVEPSTVKGLEGDFGEHFWKLVRSHVDKAQQWKEALEYVPRKRGLTYNGQSNERDFIDNICEKVKKVLIQIPNEEAKIHRGSSMNNIFKANTIKPELCLMMMEQIHSKCIFSNSSDLEQVVKDKIKSYAQRENQGFVSDALLYTCFPGLEVPSWFDHKDVGSVLKPKLLLDWCDKRIFGVALCAVISFRDNHRFISVKCTIKFKTEDGSWISFSWNIGDWSESDKIKSNHVFIGYISRPHIVKHIEEQGSSGFIPTKTLLEFEVTDNTTTQERKYCEVVKCGFTLVYADSKNVSGSNGKCFMVYARDLAIEWSQNKKYWNWLSVKEIPDDRIVEVAELIEVYWLDITGSFKTKDLTPATTYEVVFVVKLGDSTSEWNTPVIVKLTLPTGKTSEREVKLNEHMRCRWLEIPAGEFVMSPENAGVIEFSMYDHKTSNNCKKGLFVKGVAIRPTLSMEP